MTRRKSFLFKQLNTKKMSIGCRKEIKRHSRIRWHSRKEKDLLKYHFKIHKEKGRYWAECLEIPECVTQADSKKELHKNMEEAINLLFSEPEDSEYFPPLPDSSYKTSASVIEVEVKPRIAVEFLQRFRRFVFSREIDCLSE